MSGAFLTPLLFRGGAGGGVYRTCATPRKSIDPTPTPPLKRRGFLAAFILTVIAAPVLAQTPQTAPVITSAAPDKVAVTLYRDPDRGEGAINRDAPSAFALIAETRTVDLPPGVVTVRFEGVAGGIVPQSAILFGTDPRERNRDAALLSQKGLVDGFTGQSVILKRTDPATGKVTEERATIRSAADRLVMTTPRGVEAVYCTGLNQTLIYPGAPAGLSAKPVLSMTTKDQPGGRVTITLAYIASGFDWDATYVGTLADDGKSMALLSWLTMASGDETSFVDATTSAVAGRVSRSDATRDDTGAQALNAARWLNKQSQCWPARTTSDIDPHYPMAPPPPAPAPMAMMMESADIMVTAGRMNKAMSAPIAVIATSEALGDLKLYRIPVPVTVAAHSQKQVAFLNAEKVKGELVYRSKINGEPESPEMLFRFRNRKADGLGDPLPAGKAVLYQDSPWGTQLVGEAVMRDKALDEEVELAFGDPVSVTMESKGTVDKADRWTTVTATLRNANPFAVTYELEFPTGGYYVYTSLPGKMLSKPGKKVWRKVLEPGSETKLTYRYDDNERAD
ncbi:MAG: hypothetical protein ABI673_02165 [Novosphingobium sp.]